MELVMQPTSETCGQACVAINGTHKRGIYTLDITV